MAIDTLETQADQPAGPPRQNPWLFIPLLYFLQAVPVTLIQEVAVVIYKDLGIANESITRWTSLIALPWALQMLLGPLVDLSATKRSWILTGQLVIACGLAGAAFLLKTPQAFEFTLVVFGLTALMSALCNIATDGFVLLSTTREEQARFAGFMSAFYRLGRLFCAALLVFLAGLMMRVPPLEVSGPGMQFKKGTEVRTADSARLTVRDELLSDEDGFAIQPNIKVAPGTFRIEIAQDGTVRTTNLSGTTEAGRIETRDGASLTRHGMATSQDPRSAWPMVLLIAAGVYGAGHLICRKATPRPKRDVKPTGAEGEIGRNIGRTAALLALGIGGYFLINAMVRLTAHALWAALDGTAAGTWRGWKLPEPNLILYQDLGLGAVGTELAQLVFCALVVGGSVLAWKRLIVGSDMGRAITTFVGQSGFPAILFFVLFYRFPEAIVGKITPLFLKDSVEKGGLAIANEQLGILNGLLGVIGIILGGIAGGLIVSKIGLKRSFWYLAAAMHVPNLLYLALSLKMLPLATVNAPWIGPLSGTLGGVLFVDQFGYGFGFAGYMVYLMWVAQRGNFVTSHYAIGTGMGALCIAMAGVLSGVLQQNFGYTGVFIAVMALSIPGLISLLIVPLDDSHRQIKVEMAD